MSVLLVIQNFLGNINRAVLALLKGSAHVFADDADAEQLHAAQQQNQHDDGGITGNVDALNQLLQQALNPASPEKKEHQSGQFLFREGDRVMQIRNNYDILWKKLDGSAVGTGIFNGDMGVITSIDSNQETMTIVFDDRQAQYDFTQLNELEPSYAVTVHKSQGSEYRAVILTAWNASAYLLSRSILYTAITRARELLILVGREDIVAAMTENAKRSRRYSGLKLRLQGKAE